MASTHYRPEIDGLRAVAVIGVLLFHANLGFPGGFTGVDVFFVISGFLITGNIDRGLQSAKFSFYEFWFRRIRRILPSSLAVGAVSLIAGYFLLMPKDFADLSASLLAQLLMVSNFYFSSAGDYFGSKSGTWPLLHTWSLSVEEQFYLLFPFALWLVRGVMRRNLLLVCCIASFALSVFTIEQHPQEAFYLLPTRAWQLLLGAITHQWFGTRSLSNRAAAVATWIGFFAVTLPMLLLTHTTTFPGWAAIPSTVGTALLLIGLRDYRGLVHQLLASKLPVKCGVISYSLYLWHWPPLAFANYFYPSGVPVLTRMLALTIGFGLTIIAYRLIEQPLRIKGKVQQMRPTLIFTATTIAGLIALTSVSVYFDGFPDRPSIPSSIRKADQTLPRHLQTRNSNSVSATELPIIGAQNEGRTPRFVLWGDSHAYPLVSVIGKMADESDVCGWVCARNATVPTVGTWRPNYRAHSRESVAWNQNLLSVVCENDIKQVFLVCRWDVAVYGRPSGELDTLIAHENESEVTAEHSEQVLRQSLATTIKALKDSNIEIILIAQPPTLVCHPIRMLAFQSRYTNAPLNEVLLPTVHVKQQQQILRMLRSLTGPGVKLIEPEFQSAAASNRPNTMSCFSNGKPLYVDANHLSPAGAARFYGEQISSAILHGESSN